MEKITFPERKMNQKKRLFLVVLGLALLVLSSYFALGCQTDSDCLTYGSSYVCLQYQCQPQTTSSPANNTAVSANISTSSLDYSSLSNKIDLINDENNQRDIRITSLINQLSTLTQTIQTLTSDMQNFNTQLETLKSLLEQKFGTVSTGLAALQENIGSTKTQVTGLEEKVTSVESSNSLIKTTILIFLFVSVFAGVLFYIFQSRKPKPKITLELKRHINLSLKKGLPYPIIRKNLLQAGWSEESIDEAYKSVLTYNYEKAQTKTSSPKKTDKEKILVISIVSVIILLGVFFLIQKTTGSAIKFQTNFEETAPFVCTPPHIVSEGGCCLDEKTFQKDGAEVPAPNNICDKDEEYGKNKAQVSASICQDHTNCSSGQFCIDSHCTTINELYQTDCSALKCNLNNINILTSDGELYSLHAKESSYTAAGALAWSVRPMPNYCQGGEIRIPIEIEKSDIVCYDYLGQKISCDQDTNFNCKTDFDCNFEQVGSEVKPGWCPTNYNGPCYCHLSSSRTNGVCVKDAIKKTKVQIISKEIITLKIGQTSPKLTHPNSYINQRLNGFTLTLKSANEFCFP